MALVLTNSFSKNKELFIPIDQNHVKMYVCGPTVYDRPHIGNARSAVVYDILFRLLKHLYPKVTYVRNITDIDDKIINAANERGVSIDSITKKYTKCYHDDITALGCLEPTIEPKATQHLDQIMSIIKSLLEKGVAYECERHVLFDTSSYSEYGQLSKRSLDEMISGARIEVAPFKKNPTDFVLWKPAKENEKHCSFESPWGLGRPGWHIECSAMSSAYLGDDFDIHGGGADLMFPHHENEIAQSRCATPNSQFARYWVHNGFLTVGGEKMSKSLKNFKTVFELLEEGIDGATIRYFYLTGHYRKPLDFNKKAISDAKKALEKFSMAMQNHSEEIEENLELDEGFIDMLSDDLNTPKAISYLHSLASDALSGDVISCQKLKLSCNFLGINISHSSQEENIDPHVIELAERRNLAKKEKNWKEADLLRTKINSLGYNVLDVKEGYQLRPIK